MLRTGRTLWTFVLLVLALAAPSAARAATWQLTADPAPGSIESRQGGPQADLAVVKDRPYVAAVSESGQLGLHTLNADGTAWRQIGGTLNVQPVEGEVKVAASAAGAVWVAWREQRSGNVVRLHVARLWRGRLSQITAGLDQTDGVGSPWPFTLAVYYGRPYIAWRAAESEPLHAVALTPDGSRFRRVEAGIDSGPGRVLGAELTVVGRGLYLAYSNENLNVTRVARLRADARSWSTVASVQRPPADGTQWVTDATTDGRTLFVALNNSVLRLSGGKLAGVGGEPIADRGFVEALGYANGTLCAFGRSFPAPDVTVPHLVAFDGDDWQATDAPAYQGDAPAPPDDFPGDVSTPDLETSGDALWFLWSWAEGDFSYPRRVHVAKLAQ
jgi:hypothetical protein